MMASILSHIWQAALGASMAVALVLLMRPWLREQFGARIAYAFWLLVPVAMLSSVLPADFVVSDTAPIQAPFEQQRIVSELKGNTTFTAPSASTPTSAQANAPTHLMPTGGNVAFNLSAGLVTLWFLGFALSFGILMWHHYRFMLAQRLLGKNIRIQTLSSNGYGPAAIGVLQPRIILPRNFTDQFNRLERKLIIAHEKAHIRNGDVRINALAAFLACVNWFNPLVYFALKQFRIDQELACDERVMLQHGQHRGVYANTLLKSQLIGERVPIGCSWLPQALHPLKPRVARLASPPLTSAKRLAGMVLVTALISLSSASAWAMLASHIVQVEQEKTLSDNAAAYNDAVLTNQHEATGHALLQAIIDGEYADAHALVKAGADVNHVERGDGTPLMEAIRTREHGLVNLLLEAGADVNKTVAGEGSPLIIAARHGNVSAVKRLLAIGADADKASNGDGNPLIAAARRGNVEIVNLLLQSGADPNGFVLGDETPLIGAARENNLDVAKVLIAAGADANLKVETGNRGRGRAQYRSPLGQALLFGHDEMAKLLRQTGATEPTGKED